MMQRAWLLGGPLLLGAGLVAWLLSLQQPTTNTPFRTERKEGAPSEPGRGALIADRENLAVSAPARAIVLGRRTDESLAESAHAAERGAAAIDDLIRAERIGEARTAAQEFLRRFPGGPWADHVRSMTGVHVRPSRPAQAAP